MPPDEIWEDAWLNNKPMPPHRFPPQLLGVMLSVMEHWLDDDAGPRKQLEEFVPGERTHEIMAGLLYNGFCIDRTKPYRIRPIPLITQMLFQTPMVGDPSEVEPAMQRLFSRILSDWCRLHVSEQPYQVAP